MIIFALGFIAGIIVTALCLAVAFKEKETIKLLVSQKIPERLRDEDIVILDPTPPEVEAMEEVIKKNEDQGRGTELSEIS